MDDFNSFKTEVDSEPTVNDQVEQTSQDDYGTHDDQNDNYDDYNDDYDEPTAKSSKLSKPKRMALGCGVSVLLLLLFFVVFGFMNKIITPKTDVEVTEPTVVEQVVVNNTQPSSEEVVEKEPAKEEVDEETKAEVVEKATESSSSQSKSSSYSSTIDDRSIDFSKLDRDNKLSNKATVKEIRLVSETDLSASILVTFEMGTTEIQVPLTYNQAYGMSVGDDYELSYFKIEGEEKVLVVDIVEYKN